MALDLMLRTLVISPEFNDLTEKNWTQISRMIPGTTPRQCQRRYEELMKEGAPVPQRSIAGTGSTHSSISGNTSLQPRKAEPSDSTTTASRGGSGSSTNSRPSSAKLKGSKSEKDVSAGKASEPRPSSGDQGYYRYSRSKPNPIMVIHVCDEAKNLKQDFNCPRDLLIREMRYFAEYLSTDAQRWEEVDISVHCDVLIFDWLMKYVKRFSADSKQSSQLEPTNVISILISSDFLKMDSLVEECIQYCHQNLTAIVSTPCNMNCINDGLVTRIANLFNHNEADDVRDRKDKFKSKLFAKKLERLFDASTPYPCSPENASTLYRCSVCKKLLTKTLDSKIKCAQSRLMIDRQGALCYRHMRDPAWDCNDFLLELKQQLKSWRDVYWRVWGTINWLSCARCGEVFPCQELGHCQYHPDTAVFDTGPIGEYPCCNLKVLRFDPAQPNKGCKVRDHIVEFPKDSTLDSKMAERQRVYNDLLAHRDAVCVPFQRLVSTTEDSVKGDGGGIFCKLRADSTSVISEHKSLETTGSKGEQQIDVFSLEEQACGVRTDPLHPTASETSVPIEDLTSKDSKPRLQALTVSRDLSYDDEFGESDDEVGDEEDAKGVRRVRSRRVTVDPQAILLDAPDFSTTKQRKWDSSRSLRWNQDAQREEDQRRMNDIITYLTKLRFNPEKMDKLRQKEYNGGLFSKLESQWKSSAMSQAKNTGQFRNKPRLGMISK